MLVEKQVLDLREWFGLVNVCESYGGMTALKEVRYRAALSGSQAGEQDVGASVRAPRSQDRSLLKVGLE